MYVEVSKNHGIPIEDVIRYKFTPQIRVLIMYYNYRIREEQKEYERIERENEKIRNEMN